LGSSFDSESAFTDDLHLTVDKPKANLGQFSNGTVAIVHRFMKSFAKTMLPLRAPQSLSQDRDHTAEFVPRHHLGEIAMGRRHQTDLDAVRAAAAHSLELGRLLLWRGAQDCIVEL
jgi:hypothetical protein